MKFPALMIRHMVAVTCTLMFSCLGTMPSHADKRVALIIGNGTYAHVSHLPNPAHDAEDVAAALKRIGFDTIVGTDLNQNGMQNIAIRFARASRTADVALFYYSGHAIQYAGINYLVPIDAELHDEADLRRLARVDEILADLQQAKNLRILVLDSCRDNPLAEQLKRSIGSTRGLSIGRGLARMESPDGTIISYATQAGRTAEDGRGRNSPYTTAFLRHISDKEDIATVFNRISANVIETSNGTQRPELSLSFFGEFYLNGKLELTVSPPSTTNFEAIFWDTIKASRDPADFHAYLARFPYGVFVDLARNRLAMLQREAAPKPPEPPVQASGSAPSLRPQLVTRLTGLSVSAREAEDLARGYELDIDHKSVAVGTRAHHAFKTRQWPSDEAAVTAVLEKCQLLYNEPCALAAVDNHVEPASSGPPLLHDQPRTRYEGLFDPDQIPGANDSVRRRIDVASYRTAPEPKAVAYYPVGVPVTMFIIAGARSQFEAEEQALAQCNNAVAKIQGDRCFLYAVGNQVVLPQRSLRPLSLR